MNNIKDINSELLKAKLFFIYKDKKEAMVGSSLENAIKIFKEVKHFERIDNSGKVNYEKELLEAKTDLISIFGISPKGLTKNEIFLKHQSCWGNMMTIMIENGYLI